MERADHVDNGGGPGKAASSSATAVEDIFKLRVTLNGKCMPTAFLANPDESVSSVDMRLAQEYSLPQTHRLVIRGHSLTLNSSSTLREAKIQEGDTIYILASSKDAVTAVRNAQPDPLLRGFTSSRSRFTAKPAITGGKGGHASLRQKNFGFGSLRVLPGYPDRSKAETLLRALAEDPGFSRVMELHEWRVGCLAEMEPHGKVGVDPVCVLGYNVNKGAEINIRLRTDDRKGFRPMFKLKEVLAHELAHNVYSEHDKKFYELMRQIEREARQLDWTQSQGNLVGDGGHVFNGCSVDPLEVSNSSFNKMNIVRTLGSGSSCSSEEFVFDSNIVSERSQSNSTKSRGASSSLTDDLSNADIGASQDISRSSSMMEVCEGEDLPVKTDSVPDSIPNISSPASSSKASLVSFAADSAKSKGSGVLDSLAAMGFSLALAKVALRENKGDLSRATDWLLALSADNFAAGSDHGGKNNSDLFVERLEAAVSGLHDEIGNVAAVEASLTTLHAYVHNLISFPFDERVRHVNSSNLAYRERIGQYDAGEDIMSIIGYGDIGGKWVFEGTVDKAKLWLIRSIFVRTLAKLSLAH